MKAIDIATRNHISEEDVFEVCKELGIKRDQESEISDQDVFLIEKKIEVIKTKKAQRVESIKKGKKIKLKRKVHVSKEIKEKQAGDVQHRQDMDEKHSISDEDQEIIAAEETGAAATGETKRDIADKPEGAAVHPEREKRSEGTAYRGDTSRPRREGEGPRREGGAPGQRPAGTGPRREGGSGQRPAGTGPRPGGGSGQRPGGYGSRPGGGSGQRPAGTGPRPGGGPGQRPGGYGSRPGGGPGQRPGGSGPRPGGGPGQRTEAPRETPVEGLDDEKRRRKPKDKDKEKEKDSKKKYKKEKFEEKSIEIRKKTSSYQKKEITAPTVINITENVSVGELAKKMNIKVNEVIAKLMKMGEMVTINQIIDADTASILASEYGTEVKVVSLYDETIIKHEEEDRPEDYESRPPVVTVMGHVDHGKTKLLDAIRKTKVAEQEHGGITQHIGAYVVTVGEKKITFLDTPGHAAFTTMRARGAQVTDIVILVIAANDGVMPQTIEAIDHARAAGVPIIVAINKIDLEEANIKKVKNELTAYELIPEEWGGTTLFAEISAKKGINIDGLLELVLIQSEMLELKGNKKVLAKGVVIESKLDSGRGPVATMLVQRGVLHAGDPFIVGHYSGKVRAMFDDQGREIKEAGPSTPVEILGISGIPSAGDPFECVETEKLAKQVSQKRLEYKRIESAKKVRKVTLESLNEMIKDGEVQELCIIVKADVDGSAQALNEALVKLSTSEVRVKVIHAGAGSINDSDVMLASASNAVIIGYHVRPTGKVADLAERENVSIKFYNIIFEATDAIRAAMEGMLSPEIKEEILGVGEVRQVFKISKVGTIAGAFMTSGKITRKSKMRLIRDGVVVHEGGLKSLKRFKDDASEVVVGQEFGFALENFNDLKESDTFEAFQLIEVAKVL